MSRRVRIILIAVAVTIGAILIVSCGLFSAARYEPGFYKAILAADKKRQEADSREMTQGIATLATKVRKQGSWESLFTADQINGWLAIDLVSNFSEAVPKEVKEPRVSIDESGVTIACRYTGQSVLSLTFEPFITEPNSLAVRIRKARAGLVPMPMNVLMGKITDAVKKMGFRIDWRSAEADPVAIIKLPPREENGKLIILEKIKLGDGAIYFSGVTKSK